MGPHVNLVRQYSIHSRPTLSPLRPIFFRYFHSFFLVFFLIRSTHPSFFVISFLVCETELGPFYIKRRDMMNVPRTTGRESVEQWNGADGWLTGLLCPEQRVGCLITFPSIFISITTYLRCHSNNTHNNTDAVQIETLTCKPSSGRKLPFCSASSEAGSWDRP